MTSQLDAAALLGVCVRTVRNWESRRRRVPYAAYRLLRILRNGELSGDAWNGWRLWGDTLWTPEGIGLKAGEAAWWSLLVRCARAFQQQQRGTRPSAGDGEKPAATVGDGPFATEGRLASRSDSPLRPDRCPLATLPNALAQSPASMPGNSQGRTAAQRLSLPGLVLSTTKRVTFGETAVQCGLHSIDVGPEWGQDGATFLIDLSHAYRFEIQFAFAGSAASGSCRAGRSAGDQSERVLCSGGGQLGDVPEEVPAEGPIHPPCGRPCPEFEIEQCPFQSCPYRAQGRAERAVFVRQREEIQAVPRATVGEGATPGCLTASGVACCDQHRSRAPEGYLP